MAAQTRNEYSAILRPRQIKSTIQWMLADVAVIFVAFLATLSVRSVSASVDYSDSIPFIFYSAVSSIVFLYIFSIYHQIWRNASGHNVNVIIKAVATNIFVTGLVDLAFKIRPLPISVLLIGNILALGLISAMRYRTRLLKGFSLRWNVLLGRKAAHTAPITRVMIIGAGDSGQLLALRLKHHVSTTENIYKIVGLVDDDPRKQGMFVEGCPVLGTRTDIPKLVEDYEVDMVVIAIHKLSGADFRQILSTCEQTKALIKVMPDTVAFMTEKRGGMLLRDVEPKDLIGRSTVGRHEGVNLDLITNKRTLVTGAAGSIGSELARQLCINKVSELILLDNNESSLYELWTELKAKYPEVKLDWALSDITLRDSLRAVFVDFKPEIVFHAAAYKHVPVMERFPNDALRVNIAGTYNLIEFAQEFQVERFVMISTDKAVEPSCVMGASKRAGELLLRAFAQQRPTKTLFTSVRFGNVLGSRGSVVPIFNQQIDNGGPVRVTHRDMTRYFMSIPEAANLVVHAACLTKGNDMFLLRMGEVVRIVELAERLIRLRGLRPYIDINIEFTGVRDGEKMAEQLTNPSEVMDKTIHPDIMELMDKHPQFDGAAYLAATEALVKNGFAADRKALEQLRDLINVPFPALEGSPVAELPAVVATAPAKTSSQEMAVASLGTASMPA